MWVLAGEEAQWPLLPGKVYKVGRAACDIVIPPGDLSVSRQHARLEVGPAQETARPSVLLVPNPEAV